MIFSEVRGLIKLYCLLATFIGPLRHRVYHKKSEKRWKTAENQNIRWRLGLGCRSSFDTDFDRQTLILFKTFTLKVIKRLKKQFLLTKNVSWLGRRLKIKWRAEASLLISNLNQIFGWFSKYFLDKFTISQSWKSLSTKENDKI